MAPETREANDREMLVNLAIYDYHAAIDRGESPDPAEWAARNPEIAAELKAYFDDLAGLDLLRPSGARRRPGSTAAWASQVPASRSRRPPISSPATCWAITSSWRNSGRAAKGLSGRPGPSTRARSSWRLKTLRGPASSDAASVDRLREDARAIARMKHANIIRTFYFGEDRGRWFFVMELMEGGTVADRLESYKADPRSAAVLIEKIARAIHHAHTRNPGVLHLDLKPGNILLTAGRRAQGDRLRAVGAVRDDRSLRRQVRRRSSPATRTPRTTSRRRSRGPALSGRSLTCRPRWPAAAGRKSRRPPMSTASGRSSTPCSPAGRRSGAGMPGRPWPSSSRAS